MARLFTRASSHYLTVAATPAASPPITISAWVRPAVTNQNMGIVSLGSSSATQRHLLYVNNAGVCYMFSGNGGTTGQAAKSGAFTIGQWAHVCGVLEATNSRQIYVDGSAGGGNSTNVTVAYNNVHVGAYYQNGALQSGWYYDGDIAEVALWDAALSVDEITALAAGLKADRVRPGNLALYAPVWGRASPETDLFGNDLAVTGAVAAGHPPIIGHRRAQIFVPKVVSGGTANAVGSSSGVGAASAVGASTAASVGSSAGVGAASTVGEDAASGTTDGVGSAAGTGAASGVGASTAASVASAAGVATAAAVAEALQTIEAVGSADGVATVQAVGADASVQPQAEDQVTPGIAVPRKRRRKPVAQQAQDKPDPWRDVPEVDWSLVTQRVEASLQADRKARMRANAQKLMLLMAA